MLSEALELALQMTHRGHPPPRHRARVAAQPVDLQHLRGRRAISGNTDPRLAEFPYAGRAQVAPQQGAEGLARQGASRLMTNSIDSAPPRAVRGGFLARTGRRSSPNRCRPAPLSVGRTVIARRERSGEGFSPARGGDPPRTGVDRLCRRLGVRRLRVAGSPGRISRPHKAATLPNPSPRPRTVRELRPISPRRVESWIKVAGKRFPGTWFHESTNCRLAWPGWCRHGLWTGALGESVEDAATQGRHAERRRRLNFRQPAVRSRLGFGVCLRWRAPRRPGS
ncbi:MAG: hypothetical protein QOH50_3061 [Kribbellaceae bacterium]|nr:hypothetical protein [Kribbellaceae bacterium]